MQELHGHRAAFFGGEGLFPATLTGPDRVAPQSMPIVNLAEEIGRYLPNRAEASGGGNIAASAVGGGILGALPGGADSNT